MLALPFKFIENFFFFNSFILPPTKESIIDANGGFQFNKQG
jgi:hypothetical protein